MYEVVGWKTLDYLEVQSCVSIGFSVKTDNSDQSCPEKQIGTKLNREGAASSTAGMERQGMMIWERIDRIPTLSGPAKVPKTWMRGEFWTVVHAKEHRSRLRNVSELGRSCVEDWIELG